MSRVTFALTALCLVVGTAGLRAAPADEAIALVRENYYRPELIPADAVLRARGARLADKLRAIDGRLRLEPPSPPEQVTRARAILRRLGLEIVEVADAGVTVTALRGGPGDTDGLADGAILYRLAARRIHRLDDARDALAGLGPREDLQLEVAAPDGLATRTMTFAAPLPAGWFETRGGEPRPLIDVATRHGLLHAQILRFEAGRTREALERALRADPSPLLIDLRHCSGGSLKEALAIAALLLPAGTGMGELRPAVDGLGIITSHDPEPITNRKFVVLIDRHTASAAEVLASILGRTGRGRLVGERSSGKCVVERSFTLADGTTLDVPVAEFVPPGGVACNVAGVTPSIQLSAATLASSDEVFRAVAPILRPAGP